MRIWVGWGASFPYNPITIRSTDGGVVTDDCGFPEESIRLRPFSSMKTREVISGSGRSVWSAANATWLGSMAVSAGVDRAHAVTNFVDRSRNDRRFENTGDSNDDRSLFEISMETGDVGAVAVRGQPGVRVAALIVRLT